MNKLTINLDSTALGESGCILSLMRTLVGDIENPVGGYREKTLGVSLVYGIAIHKFIDTMYKTNGHYPKARKACEDSFNSIPKIVDRKKAWMGDVRHLTTTAFNVWSNYVEHDSTFEVLSINDQPATEINFSLPYYEDEFVLVNLCGTIDTVGKFKNGCYAIRDWKTTGSWNKESYFEQYEMSRQLRFYTLACKLMAERFPESVIGRVGATHMGSFIDGIFLNADANHTECIRSNVYQYKPKVIEDFRRTLDDKIQEISHAVKTKYLPKQGILIGTCEKKFGKCKFFHTCKSDDSVANVLLNRDFVRKIYDPLNFNS